MAIDILTLALARKYTQATANALGAVKGANCTIESVVDTGEANVVTFGWTGADGSKQTTEMTVRHGASVAAMSIDESGTLICTLTDGTQLEVGKIPGGGSGGGGTCDPDACLEDRLATDDDVDPLLSAIGLHDMTTAYLIDELNNLLTDEADILLTT